MEFWIRECEFEKLKPAEDGITIEGGMDEFERVDIRDENGSEIHVFKVAKRTPLFEIEMRWDVDPEGEDLTQNEIKKRAQNRLAILSSYQASHYLSSMELPPIQGLFYDAMVAAFGETESDESKD